MAQLTLPCTGIKYKDGFRSPEKFCREIVKQVNKDYPNTAKLMQDGEKFWVEVPDEYYNSIFETRKRKWKWQKKYM